MRYNLPPTADDRIVFIGDSITDGDTLRLLVDQAIREAGKPAPRLINAGIAGDTSKGMLERLDRDVLVHKPTLVCLSAGINDLMRDVGPKDYESNIEAILTKLCNQKVGVLVLTLTPIGSKHAARQERHNEFNAILARAAAKRGCPVAPVCEFMSNAPGGPDKVLAADGIHLEFEGYRFMAAAVLKGLGLGSLRVPEKMKLELLPGVITRWKVRPVTSEEQSILKEAAEGRTDGGEWKDYALPEKDPVEGWWYDQERQRGFAVSLKRVLGPAPKYVGVAIIERNAAEHVYFNPGAQLQSITLNGEQIYQSKGWLGWHAGRERIPVELKPGRNIIVITSGPEFFLSVTDTNTW